ncbi:MAG: FAD-dependent oxidoreductase, partial [Opitutaceae bacterium]|nr:FAD-dependent oxidoreductase [Opitutaceae bacterium]
MITVPPAPSRAFRTIEHTADLVIVGGGLSGTCAAIAAARHECDVVLIQDRPVPGGNSSSEVRLWVLGATVHMTTNNRWAREGGIINEIMLENLWRNPGGNPVIWDSILLEKLAAEPRVTLLLNTACHACEKHPGDETRIASVTAFNSQTGTLHLARAPLFCDASSDGVLGFLAGAAFRMGAESREEFGEAFARSDDFGRLLGHSIYFQSRDAGHPVPYVAPSFALKGGEVERQIPRYRQISGTDHGCHLWWLEWGGRLDTIHDTEKIKWELWRVAYGIWDYIKNSGKFPESANLVLDWMGLIPGKRESRRFEGDYILSQRDIVERRRHPDAVAYGGWSIDLHPADGLYASVAGSHHVFPKGIYTIPYRCYYSRNINNLFLAGRIISASHVAFGSTRVMCTCALGGQAIGTAAALCKKLGSLPRALGTGDTLARLQLQLLRDGQHLPGRPL